MKKRGFSLLPILVCMLTVISCMMHDMNKPLNINYPAAYVVNGSSNDISVIRIADNVKTESISLNGATFPHHIYLNPAKTKIAVAITSNDLSAGHAGHGTNSAGLKIMVIDAVTGLIDKEIALAKMPHNAIFNFSGNELWVGQSDDIQSKILVYNTNDWSLKNTISVGKGLSEITFSSDAQLAFACNTAEGTVSVVNTSSKAILTTIQVGLDPVGAWTGSDNKMYVDNEKSQSISIIDAKTLKVVDTIKLGFMPGYAAHNAEMMELWVTDPAAGKVHWWKWDTATGTYFYGGATSTGDGAHAIAFGGMVAYVTNQSAGTVSVLNVMTHSATKTITVGSKPNGIVLKQ